MPQYADDTDQTIAPAQTLPPAPNLSFLGAPVSNMPGYTDHVSAPTDRVAAPWQVEDQVSYYRALTQVQQQQDQMRQQQLQQQRDQLAQQQANDVAQAQFNRGLLSTPEGENIATTDPLRQYLGQLPVSDQVKQSLLGNVEDIRQRLSQGQDAQSVIGDYISGGEDPHLAASALNALSNYTASQLRQTPIIPGVQATTYGNVAAKVPGGTTALNLVGGSVPYLAAGAIAPESVEPALFGGLTAVQAQPTIDAYRNGQIDLPTATKQLAMTLGPVLAPIALTHGLGAVEALTSGAKAAGVAIGDFANSPAGQRILTEERGSVGQPPEEGAPEPSRPAEGPTPPPETTALVTTGQRMLDAGNTTNGNYYLELADATRPPSSPPLLPSGGETSPSLTPAGRVVQAMTPVQKLGRYISRFFGVETDPKAIVDVKNFAARTGSADLHEADTIGRELGGLQKAAVASLQPQPGETGLAQPFSLRADADPKVRAALEKEPDAILAEAYLHPEQFDGITPQMKRFFDRYQQVMDRNLAKDKKAGIQVEGQGDDPRYFPRITLTADGNPILDSRVTGFTHERTTGAFEDYILKNNQPVVHMDLAAQHRLESSAAARIRANVVRGMVNLGDFDGKGAAMVPAKEGGVPGYTDVPGMGVGPDGKNYLVRQDIVSESMKNAFSKGWGDVGSLVAAPARVARSVNFMLGAFHAVYESAVHPFVAARNIGELMSGSINQDVRNAMLDREASQIHLETKLGSKINFIRGRGAAISEVQQGRGFPEAESGLGKLPVLGKVSQANHDWLFNWLTPFLQHKANTAALVTWMTDHPNLVPADFEQSMSAGNDAIDAMLERNPQFASEAQKLMARNNHIAGFTENTLGRSEQQASQFMMNTPTIAKAIAANVADALRRPGDLQGTMARQWWRNVLITSAATATGGTLLANKGQSKYTDPTDPNFVLNPNSRYFLNIVTPSGTGYSLVPSPIRAPIKALFSGPAAAATAGLQGGSPQDIASAGIRGEGTALGSFGFNRASYPMHLLPAVGNLLQNRDITSATALGQQAAQLPNPVFLSNIAQNPPTSPGDIKAAAEQSVGSLAGINVTQPTPHEAYDLALRNHGVSAGVNASPADQFAARQKYPDVQQAYDARQKATIDRGGNTAIYDSAVQKAVTSQEKADTAFKNGTMTPQDWRTAFHKNQDGLQFLRDSLGIGKNAASNDPKVVQGYYKIFDQYPNANSDPAQQQAEYDALDQYVAKLSPDDQKTIDQYVGFGAGTTQTVHEYRDTVSKLQKTGFYEAPQKVLQAYGYGQYKSIADLEHAAVESYVPIYEKAGLPAGMTVDSLRTLIANKIAGSRVIRLLSLGIEKQRMMDMQNDPATLAGAIKFGLAQSPVYIKEQILLAQQDQSASPLAGAPTVP